MYDCISPQNGLPMPPTPPRPNLPPPPPSMDNGRFICPGLDEFLMMQKQNMVSPGEEQLEALHGQCLISSKIIPKIEKKIK